MARDAWGRWGISDPLWAELGPLIPRVVNTHPRGGGRKRVPARQVMTAIFFVLRTGCQWNALNATGLCSSTTAHRRFQEWVRAGVFKRFWGLGLQLYEECRGIDWEWLSMDGAMSKAPLGGEKDGAESHRPGQKRGQAQHAGRRAGRACGAGGGGG